MSCQEAKIIFSINAKGNYKIKNYLYIRYFSFYIRFFFLLMAKGQNNNYTKTIERNRGKINLEIGNRTALSIFMCALQSKQNLLKIMTFIRLESPGWNQGMQ